MQDYSVIMVYDNDNEVLDFVYPIVWIPSSSCITVLQGLFAGSFAWCNREEDAWGAVIPDSSDRGLLALKKLLRNVKSKKYSQSLFIITVTGEEDD
jgi:hypothetical protein